MKHIDRRKIRIYAAVMSFILSVLLMSLSFYIAYQEAYFEAVKKLQYTSEHTRLVLEKFMRPLNKTLRKMQNLTIHCTPKTQKVLQQIAFNSPSIALAFVSKGNKACSNIGSHDLPFSFKSAPGALLLSGPLTLTDYTEPAFILSRLHGNYRYNIVMTKETLKTLLPNKLKKFMFSAIVRLPENNIYLYKGAYSKPKLFTDSNFTTQVDRDFKDKVTRLHLTLKMPVSNDLYVYTALSTTWVWSQLSLHLLSIITLGLFLCGIAIYFIYVFTKRKLSLKSAMEVALKEGEFIPHYQPVIELSAKRVSGVECLLRWQPKDEAMIFPDSFIPTAEESGLIRPITDSLIKQVFDDLGDYLSKHADFHIAINLTPYHFIDENIIELTLNCCEKYHINPNQIIFELTEQKLIEEDSTEAVNIMKKMRKLGFLLALDDFGTGYSSLTYLQRFPFDYIKIDRQFIMAIGTGAVTEGLADSMINMGKRLNLKIIAEGVETHTQADFLTENEVPYAQGWLYSKALPKDEIFDFLEDDSISF